MSYDYDLIVIGTGPGGYVCAIRAAQLGLKVAVVEKRDTHGGTCLNVGCIPSKAMLHTSEIFESASLDFPGMGVITQKIQLDLSAMGRHRDDVINANVQGIALLLKKNQIHPFHGIGTIIAPHSVRVTPPDDQPKTLTARDIVIATGSDAMTLPGVTIDEKYVLSSTGALFLDKPPARLVVIGAGVIGLELGSVWRRLGTHVTIVEAGNRILPGMDTETTRSFQTILQKQGLEFKLSSKVTGVAVKDKGVTVTISDPQGQTVGLEADVTLVSIGRKPYSTELGIAEMGIETDERGRIRTDARFRTNIDHIYAIGDVISGPMLAHKASDEGTAVAEIIAGQAGHVNYAVIPSVVYTMPELASIGKTEDELKAESIPYKSAKFPLSANGRARAMNHVSGFVKILAHAHTDQLLGAHMIGISMGDIIHEVAVLMEFGGSAEDLARTCHAHPTVSEAVREAALSLGGGAIHM